MCSDNPMIVNRRPHHLMACAAAANLASCAAPAIHNARYPSWDPTSPVVPVVIPRAKARAYLAESKRRWHQLDYDHYSYVRVEEVSPSKVEITVIVVDHRRVVERSLATTSPGPNGLGDHINHEQGSALALVWRERGEQLGTHPRGAPPLTIDALYERCEMAVLGVHPELPVRMFFHRSGVLQHCGFSVSDCPTCPGVSIQAYGEFVPEPNQEPTHYLCTDRYGTSLPGAEPLKYAPCDAKCWCAGFDPNPEMESATPNASGVNNICQIDPAACPTRQFAPGETPHATFHCSQLLSAACQPLLSAPPQPLRPDCIGLIKPDETPEEWARRCATVQ